MQNSKKSIRKRYPDLPNSRKKTHFTDRHIYIQFHQYQSIKVRIPTFTTLVYFLVNFFNQVNFKRLAKRIQETWIPSTNKRNISYFTNYHISTHQSLFQSMPSQQYSWLYWLYVYNQYGQYYNNSINITRISILESLQTMKVLNKCHGWLTWLSSEKINHQLPFPQTISFTA